MVQFVNGIFQYKIAADRGYNVQVIITYRFIIATIVMIKYNAKTIQVTADMVQLKNLISLFFYCAYYGEVCLLYLWTRHLL